MTSKEHAKETFASLDLGAVPQASDADGRQKFSGVLAKSWLQVSGSEFDSCSPIDGETIAAVSSGGEQQYEAVVRSSRDCFADWSQLPAPKRGEVVRQLGVELRRHKEALADLMTLEMGKIRSEALGEVQEAIDIADFAVGLSRQLYGKTMHSERAAAQNV